MINFGFCYTWQYFKSLVVTGWLVTTQWVHGHPICIYFTKHYTVQYIVDILWCILHHIILHSKILKLLADMPRFLTYTHLLASSILYLTLRSKLYWTLYSTLHCTIHFALYCTLHFTMYSLLLFTLQSIQTIKWLADMN